MTEIVNEVPVIEEPAPTEAVAEVAPEVAKPGEKTDPALLLESLQKERDKRKALEAELEAERLKNQPTGEVFSDEGKVLDSKIARLEAEINATKEEKLLSGVQTTYPVLKDKSEEFQQFLSDNKGMKLETAAKAFLIENDLLEAPKPRKGLETASGGGRTPVTTGMTPEEIDNLRVNNYNEYARRIRAGTLK
mgnify:CR=1 FL=1